jgi:two-component system cell cycle response regulator
MMTLPLPSAVEPPVNTSSGPTIVHITMCASRVQDLDHVYVIAQTLAHYFPNPEQYVTAIHELLLNAVEHGNLGIGYEKKTELLRTGKWVDEVEHRLALPENIGKEVDIRLSYDGFEYTLTIADEGQGFAWEDYVLRPIDTRPNGRGLWIAFHSRFDRIAFNRRGNQVTCTVRDAHYISTH